MIRLSFRSTLVCCSLLGSISGCGQDETVYSPNAPTDEGDGGQTPTPPVTPPPTVAPTPPTPPSGTTTKLGTACTADGDCGTGLQCLTSTGSAWRGGGAAHGYCSAPCTSEATCDALTPGAHCVPNTNGGSCMLGCEPGSENNPKCQGREDVACDLVTNETGPFCSPMCRSDADCGGRKCLIGSGLCIDALAGDDELGASCDPTAEETSCSSGMCAAGITDGTADAGYCSGVCTFGFGGCGTTSPTPEKAGDAACFPAFSGAGRGDIGLCLQTCNCDADCDADKYVCAQIPGAMEALGVEGFCFEFDLEIPTDSDVVLGLECVERDAGGDAMSHADTGTPDAADGSDGAAGDGSAPSSTAGESDGAADGPVDASDAG